MDRDHSRRNRLNPERPGDVRMRGFAHRHTVDAAIAWIDAHLRTLDVEHIAIGDAAGRVLAAPIVSDVDVPGFDRATMDGYALAGEATDGASAYSPLPFRVVGDARPGVPFTGRVASGDAVRITTGAPIPDGCDAVLPAEWVDGADAATASGALRNGKSRAQSINAIAPVSPGKHVGRRGEDIVRGTAVLDRGRTLRPQDLGVLSSIGTRRVPVFRRPRVRLVVTGNELLPCGSPPHGFGIVDANGPMLAALVARDGGVAEFPGLVRDEADAILNAMGADADVILISGGSSVGVEDLAPALIAQHGTLAIHGIAMRPSSPAGMGLVGDRLVFLLPGNPVSCLCAYDFFAGRAIRALGGRSASWPYHAIRGRLARKISSPVGRLDYARVRLAAGGVEPVAVSGASILSSTTRADGFVVVPADSEGFAAGTEVEVWLYD